MEGLGGHGRLVGQWVRGLCSMQGAHGCMCVQRGGGEGGRYTLTSMCWGVNVGFMRIYLSVCLLPAAERPG